MNKPNREHHILVSTYSHGQQAAWHAYIVRRNPLKSDVDGDTSAAFYQLADVVKQHDDRWLPLLMSTKLRNATGKTLQDIFAKKCPEFNGEAWQKYANEDADFFLAVIAMPTDDPDNKFLMKLH